MKILDNVMDKNIDNLEKLVLPLSAESPFIFLLISL